MTYLRLLALSISTCSPNMSFIARLVHTCILNNSKNLEKFELGVLSSSTTPKVKYLHGVVLRGKFDFNSSINVRDINGYPKLGPKTLISNHPKGSKVVIIGFYGYDSC